jgi:type VI secretion system secreted protein Hcp
MAVVDYFLKLDGIDGESTDRFHANQIEVLSFSWGESNASNVAHGGGGGAGRVSMQDFHFTMPINKASPKLMLACASGKHIPKATLTARKAGGDQQQDFLKYSLTDVLVSSYKTAGDGSVVPTDEFTLNFLKIEFAYTPQRADGSKPTPETTTFDVTTNQGG